MTVDGTENRTVPFDAYSTTDNSSLTYAIEENSVPANYRAYISVEGDQLVIRAVPQSLLPTNFIINVCT